MYTAVARPCIRYVHGRIRAAYPAVFCHVPAAYTAVFGTRTDHVHCPCTAVYTVCTRPRATVHSLYTAAHSRVQTVYTAVHGLCTWPVRGRVHGRVYGRADGRVYGPCVQFVHGRGRPCTVCTQPPTAVYTLCTRPYTGHVHGPSVTVYTAVKTAVFMARVHGGVRTVYMPVYTAVHGVYGPCTPACNGRVHSASTAVYMVHLHGRVHCTRPCLRPVYTAVYGRVQTVYTVVYGPRT